jgi:Phosphodiester glycosidase
MEAGLRRTSRHLVVLATLLTVCAAAGIAAWAAGATQSTTTHPFAGITFTEQISGDPPLHLYWIEADLTNPAVHLRVCRGGAAPAGGRWETTLQPVSKIARRDHLEVAVNGSYFAAQWAIDLFGMKIPYFEGNRAQACGWTVSDGRLWSAHPICVNFPSLIVSAGGRVSIARLKSAPRQAEQVVSGCDMLIEQGRNVAPNGPAAPRTAVGLDAGGKTLTLLVADGRRPDESVGLTPRQMAQRLLRHGCREAMSLDSGGSSTLVIRRGNQWPVINTPSDGHGLLIPLSIERPVADALGIVVQDPRAQP